MTGIQPLDASIIIVSYNDWDHLSQLLESIKTTDTKVNEVIVVDNGSQDGTPDKLQESYPEVKLLRQSENKGYSQACNVGAHYVKSRYLIFLNQDIKVSLGWLEALISAFKTDDQVALVTGKILLMGEPEKINTCGNRMHLSGVTLVRGLGAAKDDFATQEWVDAVSGAAFAVRREVFERLGGFDPDYFMYVEDTDLSLRARISGYRCLYTPDSIVYHDYTRSTGLGKRYFIERNRYWMLLKDLRWGTILLLLPSMLLAEVVSWGYVIITDRRHWSNKIRAYLALFKYWSMILHKRKLVQQLRKVTDREIVKELDYRLAYEVSGLDLIHPIAHTLFDPIFWVLKSVVLALLWW